MDSEKANGGSADGVEAGAKPEVAFKAQDIGQWQAKQDGFFAEQNRQREQKKQDRKAKWRKARKWVFLGGGVLVAAIAAVIVILIVTKPQEEEKPTVVVDGTTESIIDYRKELMEIYEGVMASVAGGDGSTTGEEGAVNEAVASEEALQKVQEAVDAMLATPEGQVYADSVKLAQVSTLLNLEKFEETITIGETVDPNQLSLAERQILYNSLAYSYGMVGNSEKAGEYMWKAGEVVQQLGTGMGGGA